MLYYLMLKFDEHREVIHYDVLENCAVLHVIEADNFIDAKRKFGFVLTDEQIYMVTGGETPEDF